MRQLLIILSILSIQPIIMAQTQFASGADVSWLPQMEAAGYVFKNRSGVEMNCLDILKEEGINAIRIRAWVHPVDGICGTQYVTKLAREADSMGFNILIDFHCSDTWADPSHQATPAAWANDSLPQLLVNLYNYVYGVMDTLKIAGVVPKWVQIGNETNNGMMWPLGNATKHMANFAQMIDTGYSAVKAIDSTTMVIVHLSNGHDDAMYGWMFDALKSRGAKWDVIGMSVYPYWANWPNSLPWQTDDSLALVTMKDMIARYHKKVMVVEAGYAYNQPVTANHYLIDLIAKTKSVGGLGVFYWEPECYNWQDYNMGAWDPTTQEPTVALDAFLGKYATPVLEKKGPMGYKLNVYPNPFNPSATIEYELPTPSSISIAVYDVIGQKVAQLVSGREGDGYHEVVWAANEVSSGVYFCTMNSGDYFAVRKIALVR